MKLPKVKPSPPGPTDISNNTINSPVFFYPRNFLFSCYVDIVVYTFKHNFINIQWEVSVTKLPVVFDSIVLEEFVIY